MKNISKYLGAGLLLFTAACSQTQEGDQYTPNKDDAKAIHFIQSSIQKEFPQDAVQGVINVEIARPGNKGAYKVYLATKDDDYELFSVPAEATIPDGSHSVTVPVEVDLSNFVMGSNYKTTLYISSREARPGDNAAQVAQYSDKVTLSATYELEWETLYRTTGEGEEIPQLATYHYNGYYSGRDSGLEVEKAVGANIFRLKDWASGVTFKFVLHDDNTCTVPAQSIGYYNSNYNEYVYVADMAVYTGNDSAYASYPCTFDGESTFSFYLIYYVSSGYFAQGTEKLVFDTDIDTTPVVEIAFEGIETTSTGFKAPKLHFSPNEYTKYYKAAVVAGDITADAERQQEVRRQLIDDKLEAVTPVVTLLADDASVWNVPSGNYTAVALAYDSIENPCKLYTQRFTNDPNDEYAPRSLEFEFYAPENNLNYSPYNTLIWQMQTANVAAMKYLCVKTAVADYLCEALGMTLEEVTASRGYDVPEEMIAQLNSPEGRGTSFSPLDEGSTYTLALLMYNSFGDTAFVSKSASTFGYFAKDFDRTKTLEDFIRRHGDRRRRFAVVRKDLPHGHRAHQRPRRAHQRHDRHARLRTPAEGLLRQGAAHADRRTPVRGDVQRRLCDARLLERTVDLLGRRRNGRRLHRRHALLGFKPLLARRGQQLHVPALQHAAGVEFELPAPVRRFENLLVPQDEAPPAGVRTDRGPRRGIADRKHRDRRTALHDLPDGRTRRRSGESLRKHGGESPGRRQASAHGPRAPHPLIRSPHNRKPDFRFGRKSGFFIKSQKTASRRDSLARIY